LHCWNGDWRFKRERIARKEAERLLEQKSLELYETNQLLQQENHRFSNLIQALPVAMMLYDDEQVISINPSFHELFGENPEGSAIDPYGDALRLPLRSHPEGRIQHEIHRQEGVATALVQFVPLVEVHSEDLGHETLMVVIDISDRIKGDEAQQYAAFQAGIAEMSASILHNIGNIVTGMHGSLMHLGRIPSQIERLEKGLLKAQESCQQPHHTAEQLEAQIQRDTQVLQAGVKILGGLRSEEKMMQYLNKLELGIHHIGEIIQLQQRAARPDTHITRFDFSGMLSDTLSLIHDRVDKFGIEVVQTLDPELRRVELPRNPMIQMVMNFIKNSMEAIGERIRHQYSHQGRIELSTRILIPESEDGGRFVLTISDNGCGIAKERLEQIFQFGQTNKVTGSGYGLHSAINFVHHLNGELYAESDGENQGAIMVVELPIKVDKNA